MWRRISEGSYVVWSLLVALVAAGIGCDAHGPEERAESKEAAKAAQSGASSSNESDTDDRARSGPARPEQGPELPQEFHSPTMQLPRSTSVVPWKPEDDATQVVVTTEEIRVADNHVVDLPEKNSDSKSASNSDESTDEWAHLSIPELRAALEEVRRSSSDHADKPHTVHLAVDRSTPYRTVTEVIYTAGQANYREFLFIVFGEDGRRAYELHLISPRTSSAVKVSSKSDERGKRPLNLTIALEADGIRIGATGVILPARGNCPEKGPTLCLLGDDIDVAQRVERARKLVRKNSEGSRERAAAHFREIERAYDWRRLYEELLKIKEKYPEETVVKLSASPEIPFYLVVRAMDVARFKLKRRNFDTPDAFWNALWHGSRRWQVAGGDKVRAELFPHPLFAISK